MKLFRIFLWLVFLPVILVLLLLSYLYHKRLLRFSNERWDSSARYTPEFLKRKVKSTNLPHEDPNYFKTRKIIFCGMIRSNETILPHLKAKIKFLSEQFQDWHLLVVENDSVDQTRPKLLEWVHEDPDHVTILGCGVNATSCVLSLKNYTNHGTEKSRINKMAWLRNIYVEHIRNDPKLKEFDYTMVFDLDLYSQVYLDGLWSCAYYFKNDPNINAISSYGVMSYRYHPLYLHAYYDPYAHKDEKNKDLPKLKADLYMGLQHYPYDSKLMKVESSFGGMTIYKTSALLQYNYETNAPKDKYGDTECEHVTLHRKMGNIYLNPTFLHVIEFRSQDWDITGMMGNVFYTGK